MSIKHGTHLSLLIQAIELSTGNVLELGAGFFSTPYLHWKTYLQRRRLTTFDNDFRFIRTFNRYNSEWHKVVFVEDWDAIDLSGEWGVALVDHAPGERRIHEIKRLADSCDFIVVHDTNKRGEYYYYRDVLNSFKYRKDFTATNPCTTVVSNRVSLESVCIE